VKVAPHTRIVGSVQDAHLTHTKLPENVLFVLFFFGVVGQNV